MLDLHNRNFAQTDDPGGGEPGMAGQYHPLLVDQDRVEEAEGANASRELGNLAVAMGAGIARVCLQLRHRPELDGDRVQQALEFGYRLGVDVGSRRSRGAATASTPMPAVSTRV